MCLAGTRREKAVLAPTPPPQGARGPCPLSGVSPGAPLAFPLSLLFFLRLPGSHPLALALWSIPGPVGFNFLLPGVKTLLASGRLLADVIGRRPARRPRPRAPLRPPLLARVVAAAAAAAAGGGRRRRSLRGRACVCECAPGSVSVCVRPRRGQGSTPTAAGAGRPRRHSGGRGGGGGGRGRGWGSSGRAGHGAGKPALRQDAPASRQREALCRPARGLPDWGQANFSFSFAIT